MLKYEQKILYNGGGDANLLKTWSDFSSIQYIYVGIIKINFAEGGARVRALGAAGPSALAGSFGPAKASVLGVSLGTAGAFEAAGASVLGVSFGGRHADESWVW